MQRYCGEAVECFCCAAERCSVDGVEVVTFTVCGRTHLASTETRDVKDAQHSKACSRIAQVSTRSCDRSSATEISRFRSHLMQETLVSRRPEAANAE